MSTFADLGLPPHILKAVDRLGFKEPTPIQEKSIPLAMEGRDILGSAQTGTGKTLAFAIPMVSHLLEYDGSMGLVMTPTRELAAQVEAAISDLLGRRSPFSLALLIGGEDINRQFEQLNRSPRIVVGTPGRINDHLSRGTLDLRRVNFLVLDEMDKMLDMGFGIQIDQTLRYIPSRRQTLMFSATMPTNIIRLSEKYLINPTRIAIGSLFTPADNIKQQVIKTSEALKYTELVKQIDNREGSILIFVKTRFGAERLAIKLARDCYNVEAIHGDLSQARRDKVIANFREQKYRILVATDIASRGLDIPHIEHVINYDLPQMPEDYIHRIGRTARAGANGSAVCLLTPSDNSKWKMIHKLMTSKEAAKDYTSEHVYRDTRVKNPFRPRNPNNRY